MNAIESYVLLLCGSGVVCAGVLLLFLVAVMRRGGGHMMMIPALSVLVKLLFREKDSEAEDEDIPRRSPRRRRREANAARRSFAADRQAVDDDFEAALRQHQGENRQAGRPARPQPRPRASDVAWDDFDNYQPPTLRDSPRRSRRDTRRSGADSVDDEMLGGVFDTDGDGYPDS